MSRLNERQHYVSRVLLERFKIQGSPLQCYQVQTGEWKPRSTEKACAAGGYNQLLGFGSVDNTLEESFSRVESRLPQTFRALEKAAEARSTELPVPIYENMCWYCAFLKGSSLPAKASAVVNFVFQLNWELQNGQHSLLRELQIPKDVIARWREGLVSGGRVIIDSENALQLLYRNQFLRLYGSDFAMFRDTRWTISKSPIELPMSDVGLIPIHLTDQKANYYILPIGPKLALEGIFFFDLAKNVPRQPLRGLNLTQDEAQYRFDAICASAVAEIICSRRMPNILESVRRARTSGISFHKIVSPKDVASAGLRASANELRFRIVSVEEYVKFVHAFVKPPTADLPT